MRSDENITFCELTTKQEANLSAYISSYVQLTSDFTLQELCKNVYDLIYAKNKNESEALTNVSFIPKILSSGAATDEDIYIALKRNDITHNNLTELQFGDFKEIGKVREFLKGTENIRKNDESELIPYRKGDKWGFCDKDKNIIIDCEYSRTYPFKEGLARTEIKTDVGNCGYVDETGKELNISILHHHNKDLSPGRLLYIYDFREGVAKVCPFIADNEPWYTDPYRGFYAGFIDRFGKEIIPCDYYINEMLSSSEGNKINAIGNYFSEGLVRAQKDDKWGFLDKNGKNITSFKYDEIKNFYKGTARVCIGYRWGYIDKTGKEIFPVKLLDDDYIIEERARAYRDGKYGFYDKSGKEIVNCKYDNVLPFSQGLAQVLIKEIEFCEKYDSGNRDMNGKSYVVRDKWGVIDKSGSQIVPFKYDKMLPFSEEFAGVRLLIASEEKMEFTYCRYVMYEIHKWGFINKNGNEIIPFIYDEVLSFSEGLAGVRINDKWGFIDKNGNEIIPCQYEKVRAYKEGIAWVAMSRNVKKNVKIYGDYKWGLIDKNGNQITSFQYNEDSDFYEELAHVKINNEPGYINKKGVEIIPCGKYEELFGFSKGIMRCRKEGKYGFVDKSGREVVPCIYDQLDHFVNGLAWAGEGYIDKEGVQYWEE